MNSAEISIAETILRIHQYSESDISTYIKINCQEVETIGNTVLAEAKKFQKTIQEALSDSRYSILKPANGMHYPITFHNGKTIEAIVSLCSIILIDPNVEPISGTFKTMNSGWRIEFPPGDIQSSHSVGIKQPQKVAVLQLHDGEDTKKTQKTVKQNNEQEKEMLVRFEGQGLTPDLLETLRVNRENKEKNGQDEYLIESLCEGGDLSKLIRESKSMGKDIPPFIAYQVIRIVAIFHTHGFVHRDIKPNNFFLQDKEHYIVRAGDLGSLCRWRASNPKNEAPNAGTPYYMSPECFELPGTPVHPRSTNLPTVDIWAIGLTILELIGREDLIDHISRQLKSKVAFPQLTQRTATTQLKNPLQIESQTSLIIQLAQKCLHISPLQRPFADALLKDPILKTLLIASSTFLSAIENGFIPIEQIYQDLFDFKINIEERYKIKEKIFIKARTLALQISQESKRRRWDEKYGYLTQKEPTPTSSDGLSPQLTFSGSPQGLLFPPPYTPSPILPSTPIPPLSLGSSVQVICNSGNIIRSPCSSTESTQSPSNFITLVRGLRSIQQLANKNHAAPLPKKQEYPDELSRSNSE